MPSNHLIPCRPLLLPPSIFPSIRAFSNELALRIRWPKYWSFSFSISPSSEYFSRYCCCPFYSCAVGQFAFRSGLESYGIGLEALWSDSRICCLKPCFPAFCFSIDTLRVQYLGVRCFLFNKIYTPFMIFIALSVTGLVSNKLNIFLHLSPQINFEVTRSSELKVRRKTWQWWVLPLGFFPGKGKTQSSGSKFVTRVPPLCSWESSFSDAGGNRALKSTLFTILKRATEH